MPKRRPTRNVRKRIVPVQGLGKEVSESVSTGSGIVLGAVF